MYSVSASFSMYSISAELYVIASEEHLMIVEDHTIGPVTILRGTYVGCGFHICEVHRKYVIECPS